METQLKTEKTGFLTPNRVKPRNMQKPKKFRTIFAELKGAINNRASDQFLAESAQSLIDLYEDETTYRRKKFAAQDATAKVYMHPAARPQLIGKTVARSRSIDRWTREGQPIDLRWAVCAEMDIPSEDDLSAEAKETLAELISGY